MYLMSSRCATVAVVDKFGDEKFIRSSVMVCDGHH
jgi:hypothetical protein